ncbi:hypothetical protein F7731_16425 [Cytobacillus depressus]|uniref:Transporter n=1 Tax=Cytobacillus depressus TaxID=1602942 RepID=A0A6L3V2T4_9BACI|nr:hypothetical protein F7731_16425 [Cytobacillus depressus]
MPLHVNQPAFDERAFPGGGFGPPGFPPGGPPPSPPPGGFQPGYPSGGQLGGPPSSPPPAFIPQMLQSFTPYAVELASIRRCLYRFTHVWLDSGRSFWFYPVSIGRNFVAGWRWSRRQNRWVYWGTDIRRIYHLRCF